MSNNSANLSNRLFGIIKKEKANTSDTTTSKESADFVEFYSQNIDRVYRYILVNVGDPESAQDLASETFFAAMKQLHRFRGESTLLAWVLGIARYKIKDYFRKHRDVLDIDSMTHITSTDPLPEEIAERQWQLEQINRAMCILTHDRAQALTLYVFAELDLNEIGSILGKSDAAIKILVYRAIQDLKKYLAMK